MNENDGKKERRKKEIIKESERKIKTDRKMKERERNFNFDVRN